MIETGQHRFEDRTAHVLEIDVHAVWTRRSERGAKIRSPMRHAAVEAKFGPDKVTLVLCPRNTHNPASKQARNLAYNLTHPAGRGGHYDGLASLRLALSNKSGISSEAKHAKHTEGRGYWGKRGVELAWMHVVEVAYAS